ncbi:MAG TPA: flagellar biosynthesis regulator FlaF [Roseiarcus sp.]|jgi:flagellar protein FlaF
MYQFSYAEVAEESPQEMRGMERRVLDQAIGLLRAAQSKGPGSRELIDALFYYRRLWSIFMDDLANPENELPEALRAGLISIGIWMVKEIELIRSGKASDLRAMIEITEIIRDGLK